jgi:hypothetical protein
MASFRSPKHAFNSEELDQLQWIFDSLWQTIKAHYPSRDPIRDEALKRALRRKLFELAGQGVKQPESFRDQILRDLPPHLRMSFQRGCSAVSPSTQLGHFFSPGKRPSADR